MNTILTQRVAHVPQLYETSDKSTAGILEDIGYFDEPEALLVDDMAATLKHEPLLADMWLDRAGDQRFSGGWGIDCVDGEYRVQNYADGKCLKLRDRSRACAEFAVCYLGFMAQVVARCR